jgi:hypothetical protein
MDITITYEAVQTLLVNPPSLNPHPNFFNICKLRSHFARALKKIPCPKSPVNGWAGAVISPEMYILIDPTPFHLNITPTTLPPAYPIKYNPEVKMVPYTCKEKSTTDTKFSMVKNYFKTWKNIYHTSYDTFNVHVNDAFKIIPPSNPPTIAWNATMSLHDIFDQLVTTYGKPTPDTMHQNNLMFLAAYNPHDPSKLLFKRCTNCQEISTLAQNLYTTHQLLLNGLDLIARCGLYQHDIEDWERKLLADQMWINLCPFIQEAYQQRLASETITSTQCGYAKNNHFAGLTTNKDSDNHSGHNYRNNPFAHGKSLCANNGHNQQAHNADECVPPTAHSKHIPTSPTAISHHEPNGNDIIGRCVPRCSGSGATTTKHTRPTTDLPTPSITPLSTRVLQHTPRELSHHVEHAKAPIYHAMVPEQPSPCMMLEGHAIKTPCHNPAPL